jgi:hypothetical protein
MTSYRNYYSWSSRAGVCLLSLNISNSISYSGSHFSPGSDCWGSAQPFFLRFRKLVFFERQFPRQAAQSIGRPPMTARSHAKESVPYWLQLGGIPGSPRDASISLKSRRFLALSKGFHRTPSSKLCPQHLPCTATGKSQGSLASIVGRSCRFFRRD